MNEILTTHRNSAELMTYCMQQVSLSTNGPPDNMKIGTV